MHDHLSKAKQIISGVSLGSILNPLPFPIYTNDLSDCLKKAVSRTYADDTNTY